jgi:hypothetical protein
LVRPRKEHEAAVLRRQPQPAVRVGRGLRRAATGGVALALTLGGCGWFGGAREPVLCPEVQLLAGAERTSSYAGSQPRSADLRYVAGLTGLRSGCRYDRQGVEVDISFEAVVEPGPALGAPVAPLTYFVASLGPAEQVLAKRLVTTEVAIPPGRERVAVIESLMIRIPVASPAEAAALRVLVGFQLDEPPARRPPPLFTPLPLPPPEE